MSGAELFSINGKPLEQVVGSNTVLGTLKKAVAELESGKIKATACYVIIEAEDEDDASLTRHLNFESGLTLAHSVYLLESHKVEILQLAKGLGAAQC